VPSLNQPVWLPLFADNGASSGFDLRRFRLLRRHGEQLLFLPDKQRLWLGSLPLYQPQTKKARIFLSAIRLCLGTGLTQVLPRIEATVGRESTLARFMTKLGGTEALQDFAVLAGNPRTAGRRFVLLAFDALGQETFVVKAAFEPAGCNFIEHEIRFLQAHGGRVRHIPQLLGATQQSPVAALALPFQPGTSPKSDDMGIAGDVLGAWFSGEEQLDIASFPQWRRFVAGGGSFPQQLRPKLESVRVKPVIFHGDFAPWNLRVDSNNRLMVLDWERGEDQGIPGWDWFHYVVQTSILVHKEKAEDTYRRIVRLLRTPEFINYARHAGFGTSGLLLFAGYLGYTAHSGQTERGQKLVELRDYAYKQKLC
jgi:hypothetical protein